MTVEKVDGSSPEPNHKPHPHRNLLPAAIAARLPDRVVQFSARFKVTPLSYRILNGTFWSLAGFGAARILGLAASIFVARILTRTGFGELGIIQATVGMFGTVAGIALGLTATKFVAEHRNVDPERTARVIALSSVTSVVVSVLLTIVLVVLAPWLAQRVLNAPHLTFQLRLGAVVVLLDGINGAQTGILSGFEAFRRIARINLWVGLSSVPSILVGVLTGGLTGVVLALILNVAVNCLLSFLAVREELRRNHVVMVYERLWEELPVLWSFSLPTMLTSLTVTPAVWLASALLARSAYGYGGVGAFSAATQWRNLIVMLPWRFGSVALPLLSNSSGSESADGHRKVLKLYLLTNALVASALCVGVILFANRIAAGYGPTFASTAPVFRWMALVGLLMALSSFGSVVAASLGRAWVDLVMNVGFAALLVGSTYLLVPRAGAVGLAVAHGIAYLGLCAVQSIFLIIVLRRMYALSVEPAVFQR